MDFFTRRGAVTPIGDLKAASATVDQYGAVATTDQATRWLFEGRMFAAAIGDGSTEIDFGKSAYDENQPQIVLLVPNGVTAVPVSVNFAVEVQEDVPAHVVLGYTSNNIGNGSSNSVVIRPMRTDAPIGTRCTVRDLYTGNSTALTNKVELHRWTMPYDRLDTVDGTEPLQNFEWGIRTHSVPLLVGPASFIVWAFGETTSDLEGYATLTWAEFTTADLLT